MRTHIHSHAVLLLEHDDAGREALTTALDLLGVTAVGVDAKDGPAALRGGLRWCVIMVDWCTAEMGAEAFLRVSKRERAIAGIPVVILREDPLPESALGLGISATLWKPVRPAAVFDAIVRLCPSRTAWSDIVPEALGTEGKDSADSVPLVDGARQKIRDREPG